MHPMNHRALKTGLALFAGAGLAFAGPAVADTIEGTVDGKEYTWQIVTDPEGEVGPLATVPTGSWSEIADGVYMISIHAHVDNTLDLTDSLSMTFSSEGMELFGTPHIDFYPSDELFPTYADRGEGDLQIDSLDVRDGVMHLSGSYTGTLRLIEGVTDAGDDSDTVEVEMEFDVALDKRD